MFLSHIIGPRAVQAASQQLPPQVQNVVHGLLEVCKQLNVASDNRKNLEELIKKVEKLEEIAHEAEVLAISDCLEKELELIKATLKVMKDGKRWPLNPINDIEAEKSIRHKQDIDEGTQNIFRVCFRSALKVTKDEISRSAVHVLGQETAISELCSLLKKLRSGSSQYIYSLDDLGSAVYKRFVNMGTAEDLDQAIRFKRLCFGLFPPEHPNPLSSLGILTHALFVRFENGGAADDLEEALEYSRTLVKTCPQEHPNRASFLQDVGKIAFANFRNTYRMQDLQEAIMFNRICLELSSPGDPGYITSLRNLAKTLFTRFRHTYRMPDLEEAILYGRECLELCPPGHIDHMTTLRNLVKLMFAYFRCTERIKHLDEAMQYNRLLLELCPPGHPDHEALQENFANVLLTTFRNKQERDFTVGFPLPQDVSRALPSDIF